MNKIKLVLFLCVAALGSKSVNAQIKFTDSDYKQALKEAKAQKKTIFIDFYTSWCQPCKAMDSKVFSMPNVGDYFSKNFISLKLDAEKPENADLVKQFAISSFPSMVFIDENGKEIKRIGRAMPADEFMREVQSIGDEDINFEDMYAQYRKDKKDFDTQQKLLLFAPMFIQKTTGYEKDKWSARIEALFTEYVKNKGLDNMINESDFMIFTTFHIQTDKEDKIVPFVGKNYGKYKEFVSEQLLSTYIVELNNDYTISLAKKGNQEYKKALSRINEEYKDAYSNMDFGQITPYQAFSYLADGTYYLYKQRDNTKFIETMDSYFKVLDKDISVNDYTLAIESIHTVNDGNLKDEEFKKVIEWVDKALLLPMAKHVQVRLMMILADSNRKLGNNDLFRKNMNIAYLLTSEVEDARAKEQLQKLIKGKLDEL